MADRIFVVRVNLDALAAELLMFDTDEERGQWLAGFQVGASGTACREAWSEAKQCGWGFGCECHAEASKFRESKARGGHASAGVRKAANGTAQPQKPKIIEHCSNTARTEPEQIIEQPSNQPTANSQQPVATSEHPPEQRARDASGGRIPVSAWSPLQEHRDLCAVRNVDCDLQLSRFRERNNGQEDTDQGWGVRFRQWLGRSRPERSLPAEAAASPTMQEWIDYARTINNHGPLGKWPREAAEAGWEENQAKGWKWVADWQADCRARAKRWAANEATQAQRRRG